jgi:hypothetical protein
MRPLPNAAFAATVVAAAAYLPTAARGIGFVDRGELAAVATTLGIAHPTGYPTLTLLGRLATGLAPRNPVIALNLMSALWVALGVGALTWLYHDLLVALDRGSGNTRASHAPWERPAVAALAALGTGFTEIWWQQSNGFEAYALQSLLLPLICVTFLRFVDAAARADAAESAGDAVARRSAAPRAVPPAGAAAARRSAASRAGQAFAFVLGLGFTNHLTTLLLAPGFLAYYFARLGSRGARRLPGLVLPFLLGITPYVYLPLRSLAGPRFDWGAPRSLGALLAHVTGHQYQGWMFSGGVVVREQLGYLAALLPGELAYAGIPVALMGAWWIARSQPRLAMWAALIAAASTAYLSGFAIRELDPYAMPLLLVLGACMAAGWWALRRVLPSPLVVVLAAGLAAGAFALHLRSADESRNTLAENLTRDVLESLPPRAVLFSTLWEYVVSPSYYLQAVAGVRPDVTVISPDLMRWPWYLDELRRRDPGLVAAAGSAFVTARGVLELEARLGRSAESRAVETRDSLLAVVVDAGRRARRVFVTVDLAEADWAIGGRVPLGLATEVRTDTSYVPAPLPRTRYAPWIGHPGYYPALTSRVYAESMLQRARYEAVHGRLDAARRWAVAATRFRPPFGPDALPPLSLNGRELVLDTFAFFDRLEQAAGTPPAR